jgi:hypothetical protein
MQKKKDKLVFSYFYRGGPQDIADLAPNVGTKDLLQNKGEVDSASLNFIHFLPCCCVPLFTGIHLSLLLLFGCESLLSQRQSAHTHTYTHTHTHIYIYMHIYIYLFIYFHLQIYTP